MKSCYTCTDKNLKRKILTCSLSSVDQSFPNLPVGKHRRRLNIVPVFASEGINAETIMFNEKKSTHTDRKVRKIRIG